MSSFDEYAFDTNATATSGVAYTTACNPPAKACGRMRYYLKVVNPATLGLLFFTAYWTDRDGTPRAHTAVGLTLGVANSIVESELNFYCEDADPAQIDFEITPVGVVGSYTYEWWFHVEGRQGY